MKIKLTTLLLIASMGVMAQTKKDSVGHGTVNPMPKTKGIKFRGSAGTTPIIDTVQETYTLHFKDVQLLYDLLQAGYQGVSNSDNFSKNQAKQFLIEVQKVDSIFKPQILKWHPQPKQETKNK